MAKRTCRCRCTSTLKRRADKRVQSHVVAVVRIAVNRRGPGFVGVRKGRRKEWYAFFTAPGSSLE